MPRKFVNRAPFKGGRDGCQSRNNKFWDHDDRDYIKPRGNKHRVMFKNPVVSHSKEKKHYLNLAMKHYYDDDIAMGDTSGNNKKSNIRIPRGALKRKHNRHHLSPSVSWFKVTIEDGAQSNKEYILHHLNEQIAPNFFVPIDYHTVSNDVCFYLDESKDANTMAELDKKITNIQGKKLSIGIQPGIPHANALKLNNAFKDRIKMVLGKRYVEEHKALNLSCLHRDPDLATDYFCVLFRPAIFTLVMKIVSEHVPNLEALNLDNNKLIYFNSLSTLKKMFPNLKILHVGDNRVKNSTQINFLENLDLTELSLSGNPFYNQIKSNERNYQSYVSRLRQKFPNLKVLDGQTLNANITFDTTETVKCPPAHMLYASAPELQNIATQFLLEYFQGYDTNRENLLNAYHENAICSMSISYQYQPNKLSTYFSDSRNLKKVSDPVKRQKLLKVGRLSTVSFLSTLPKTKHIESSFTMDTCLVNKEMMMITVTGLFKELDGKDEPLRYFNRTMMIVPQGCGYCICNEQLHITHASSEQRDKYYLLKKSQSNANTPIAQPAVTTPTPTPIIPQEEMKRMAVVLCQQTNMKMEWSVKCLQECNWNFENAVTAFQNCMKNGHIPSEALNQ